MSGGYLKRRHVNPQIKDYIDDAVTAGVADKADLVNGTVPTNQLPSYVDDVLEVANYAALPVTGEAGLIYVTIDNNKTYRWTGSVYVEISPANIESYANLAALPVTGDASIVYITLDTNKLYRWDGAAYVEISPANIESYANLAALPVSGDTAIVYITLDTNKLYRWDGAAYVELSASTGGGTSGTFSEVITVVSGGVSAGTAVGKYIRVGDVVHVHGYVAVVAGVGGTGTFDILIPLPVASNFTVADNARGVATAHSNDPILGLGRVSADAAADKVLLTVLMTAVVAGTSTINVGFSYSYDVA